MLKRLKPRNKQAPKTTVLHRAATGGHPPRFRKYGTCNVFVGPGFDIHDVQYSAEFSITNIRVWYISGTKETNADAIAKLAGDPLEHTRPHLAIQDLTRHQAPRAHPNLRPWMLSKHWRRRLARQRGARVAPLVLRRVPISVNADADAFSQVFHILGKKRYVRHALGLIVGLHVGGPLGAYLLAQPLLLNS